MLVLHQLSDVSWELELTDEACKRNEYRFGNPLGNARSCLAIMNASVTSRLE
jgi:hypothetical protein